MAQEVEKINGIAFSSIEKINGRTDANIEKINGIEFSAPSFGPPEFDALGVASGFSVPSTATFQHTCGTAAGRGLLVGVMQRHSGSAPSAPTGVTYDGTAMTQEGTATTDVVRTTVFSLINPSSGENDCVVTFATTGGSNYVLGSLSFEGLNQTDAFEKAFEVAHSATGVNGENVTASQDTSSVAGQFVASFISWSGNPNNEALGTNMSGLVSSFLNHGYGYQEASGTTTTMGYNYQNNPSHTKAHVGVRVLADVYS